ncbi:MAG TPA: hypothetical protein VGK59_23940 [Ohtaekwangia sp.]
MKTVLIVMILGLSITHSFAQEGLWIQAYSYTESEPDRFLKGRNRTLLRISKDSVFTFDAGKEQWEGKLVNGFKYTKSGNGFAASDEQLSSAIFFELNGKEQLKLHVGEEFVILTKLKPSVISSPGQDIHEFVFSSFFKADLGHGQVDTVSFYGANDELQYNFTNIGAELFTIDDVMFMHVSHEGEKVYPILSLNKDSIVLGSYYTTQSDIVFTRIALHNVKPVQQESLLLSKPGDR